MQRNSILDYNKRENRYAKNMVIDSLVVFVFIFTFVIIGLVAFKFFGDIKTELVDNDDGDLNDQAKGIITTLFEQFPLWLDGAVITVIMLFWIVLIGLTFVIDSHPIIWGIVIVLLVFLIFVGATLSNTYKEISLDDEFSFQAVQLNKTQWIMDRLPYLITLIILTLIIAISLRSRIG